MQMKTSDIRVKPGETVDLKKWPTSVPPVYASKRDYNDLLDGHVAKLSDLQEKLFATNKHAVLVILQAMDAAGKDGAIKHVMSGVNPQGCDVTSFRHPSAAELEHDFLWRTTRDLPARGKIGIFNRSYYEEVLIVRVDPSILEAEAVPDGAEIDGKIWRERYKSITGFEDHMHRNGTRIVKIFLHDSKSEQKKRLLERIDDPKKNWKISASDLEARKHWKKYRHAYETCIAATSTTHAPWYVVPADDKLTARLYVSQIILEVLEGLDMSFPEMTGARLHELQHMRDELEKK